MPIKIYKPTTNARRNMSVNAYVELTTDKPFKALTVNKKKTGGRNHHGSITCRHMGGGNKQRLRQVDFFYLDKQGIPATVETVEYDPNRSSYVSLVLYADGERRYVIAHKDIKVGDKIITEENAKPVAGNRLLVSNVPVGLFVHNVETIVGNGAQMARSAGSFAQVLSQEGEYTQVKVPSGEIRLVNKQCWATIGVVSNIDWNQIRIGKAGRSRHMGIRPTVLGKSMNAVDHPHGGGEGHCPIGLKYPKTPWGQCALGKKTRRRKYSTRWILQDRRGKLLNG